MGKFGTSGISIPRLWIDAAKAKNCKVPFGRSAGGIPIIAYRRNLCAVAVADDPSEMLNGHCHEMGSRCRRFRRIGNRAWQLGEAVPSDQAHFWDGSAPSLTLIGDLASCSLRDLCRLRLEIMQIVDRPLGMGRRDANAPAFTESFQTDGDVYCRARYAGFDTKSEAWHACGRLALKNIDCYALTR